MKRREWTLCDPTNVFSNLFQNCDPFTPQMTPCEIYSWCEVEMLPVYGIRSEQRSFQLEGNVKLILKSRFLSDERPLLEKLDLAICISAIHQHFCFRLRFAKQAWIFIEKNYELLHPQLLLLKIAFFNFSITFLIQNKDCISVFQHCLRSTQPLLHYWDLSCL